MGTENFDTVVDRDASGAVLVQRMFGSGFDEVLSRSDASGVRWYGTDRLGTVHEWFDASGVRVGAVVQFDGYGAVVSGALSDRYGFTGREWDSVIGLQYSRARMYSPTQGRFTSEDPLGLRAGDANFYRYVGNQPTGRVDPSGLIAPFVAGAAIGGGFAALSYYATTPENERTSGGLARAVAVGALSGALGGYVFGSYFAGATAPVTSALITRAGVVSGAYAYSAGYALEKYLKGEAINFREYASGLAWSSMFGGAFARAGSWFAQGGAEKAANGAKDILKGLRGQKCQAKPNGAAPDAVKPDGYTRMQDYIRHLDDPATAANTRLTAEQVFVLRNNLLAIGNRTVPAASANIQGGRSVTDATQGLQGQLNLPRFRFIDQVPGGRAAIDAILQAFPNLTFPH